MSGKEIGSEGHLSDSKREKSCEAMLLCNFEFFYHFANANALEDFALEDLMDLDVSTVSKRVQPLISSPAAIYVITNAEISRSGATSVPEALRLAPGVEAFRVNSSSWAVSIRGLDSMYSQNLLVLIDGRSVYTPFYGGVYWDLVMPNLVDISRIEVIRGPGASLWGVNAVNGVVNIITKSSEVTQGFRVVSVVGNEESHVRIRAGDHINNLFYRAYVVYRDVDSGTEERTGRSADDEFEGMQFGGRADLILNDNKLTVQSDFSSINRAYDHVLSDQLIDEPEEFENETWNILTRWHQRIGGNQLQLQAYYDHTYREEPGYDYSIDSYDIDLQYNVQRTKGHQLTWGANYRHFDDETEGSEILRLTEARMSWDLYSVFVQDEWQASEKLAWTFGMKIEKTEDVDTAWQPTVRFNYQVDDTLSYWGSVSQAERIPTRIDSYFSYNYVLPGFWRDAALAGLMNPAESTLSPQEIFDLVLNNPQLLNPSSLQIQATIEGNRELESEKTLSFELGSRWLPRPNLLVDIATYYSLYRDMRSLDLIDWSINGDTIYADFIAINKATAKSYGIELVVELRSSASLSHKFHFNHLEFIVDNDNDNDTEAAEFLENVSPSNQFSYRTYWDIDDRFQFDWNIYYVDEITGGDDPDPKEYIDLDLRFGWQLSHSANLSLSLKNLFHKHRFEYQENLIGPERTEVDRSVLLQLSWKH